MKLNSINITNVRNIKNANLDFNPHFNFICGPNGAGKTSFLEAIYLLSTGYSFRSRKAENFIRHSETQLNVFAKTDNHDLIAIQKSVDGNTEARINKVPCRASSVLAAFLPSLIFYQDIFQFIDEGPALRRTFLDWGLFHVEPNYFDLIKDYRRVLKQRNNLLKTSPDPKKLAPWDRLLAELAEKIHLVRADYCQRLEPIFVKIAKEFAALDCSLHYYKGWDKKNEGLNLNAVLTSSYQRDCVQQYTHYGAHQADLWVASAEYKARNYLSRGQQKAILFALKFAQSQLLSKSCILLIDDLVAELDEQKVIAILEFLQESKCQAFITARPKDIQIFDKFLTVSKHYKISDGNLT